MDKYFFVKYCKFHYYKREITFSAVPTAYYSRPCIGYVRKGYAKFLYQGQTFYAHEGDLIYIAAETTYYSIWFGFPDIEWYTIDFEFNSRYTLYNYRFQILKNYPAEFFEKIYAVYKHSPWLAISIFYQLIDDLYRKLSESTVPPGFLLIEPAIQYIEGNYPEQITVKQLADLCHMSESCFFKHFKKAVNTTPIKYKHNIMIQHAIELLVNTTMSIEEISTKIGFPSSNYFRKIFWELTEKKPTDLRKKRS